MALKIIKETIELQEVQLGVNGSAFITKRINLQEGKAHRLLQIDVMQDAFPNADGEMEIVVSPYPTIPTNMDFQPVNGYTNRYVAGGDDSVLFKLRRALFDRGALATDFEQFPSPQIAAQNKTVFYSDHVYLNLHVMGTASSVMENIAFSFMLVIDDKNVSSLTHTLGVMAESHDAMCALIMSNGRLTTVDTLRGNTFPMWRYGGIRPEHMASEPFFLGLATTDEEPMRETAFIRGAVSSARRMQSFDEPFGDFKYPDWIRMHLNQGITTGAVRPDPIPLKYADNGNTRMF